MASGTRGRFRDALRQRDFRLLILSAAIDGLGSWTYAVVIVVVVFRQTHDPFWIAALAAGRWVPGLILSGYAGVLADRYERTRVMVVSALLSAAVMAAITAAVALHAPVWTLFAGSVASAFSSAPYNPAAGALTPDVVDEKDLTAANALLATLENVMVVLGPAVGGALLLTGEPVVGLALNTASFVIAALIVSRVRTRSRGEVKAGDSMWTGWRAGWSALISRPWALVLVLCSAVDTALYGVSSVIYAPLSERLGTGPNGYSYLLAANALGAVLAAGIANRLAEARRLAVVVVVSLVLQALPFALTAFTHSPAVAAALQLTSGVGMIIVDVLALTGLQRDLPSGVLSRVLGLFEAFMLGGCVFGSFLASGLIRATSVAEALLIVGFGFSGLALAALPALLRGDRQQAEVAAGLAGRVDLLAAIDLFAGASRPTLERLARGAAVQTLPPGEVLIRQGDPPDAVWVIDDGTVEVSYVDDGGIRHDLPPVTGPSYVGEIGLLRKVPRTATVVGGARPSRLLRISGDQFLQVLGASPVSTGVVDLIGVRWSRTAGRATQPSIAGTVGPTDRP